MPRLAFFFAVLLIALHSFPALCAPCAESSTISIANQPTLETIAPSSNTGTGIIANDGTVTSSDDARLLQINIKWDLVVNRTVSLVAIGSAAADCNAHISNGAPTVTGWTHVDDSDLCTTNLYTSYKW